MTTPLTSTPFIIFIARASSGYLFAVYTHTRLQQNCDIARRFWEIPNGPLPDEGGCNSATSASPVRTLVPRVRKLHLHCLLLRTSDRAYPQSSLSHGFGIKLREPKRPSSIYRHLPRLYRPCLFSHMLGMESLIWQPI